MAEIKGADLLAKSLKEQGVQYMFGVVGFPVGPLAEAAQKVGLPYIGMRNEQTASYAAGAVGYLTGRPGSCIVVTGPGVVHGLAGLANAQQNCWPMILIGGASETYRNGMGAFQEERQVLGATPFCKWAHGIEHVNRALDLLASAQRPLVIIGKGMAYANAENEVRAFIERTQLPFLRSPMGKGVVPDDHPLSVAAARTLALQQADVVFLMGARFNWIMHFGQAPRYAPDVKVIQLDIEPEAMHQNKPADVPLLGDGKAIMAQLNQALSGRQWFYPKETPWRDAITKKARENAETIRPQIEDDSAPGNYYRLLKDVREWMPKNAILSAEGAGTMDIGLTQLPSFEARACLNAGTYGTMGVGLGQAIAAAVVHPDRPVVHLSGDSAIGFSGMEMETLCRYGMPVKIVVLNNGGVGPGMPEIPQNPMLNMRPNTLIWGARYDKMMQAFGGYGAYVEDPRELRGERPFLFRRDGRRLLPQALDLGHRGEAGPLLREPRRQGVAGAAQRQSL